MAETTIQPLKADPKRQANDSLRGYLYQIWHSVDAWLDLGEDEVLYLEGAEDFDRISDDTATVVQVKDTKRPITLRSPEVNDAINNYWDLRTKNPSLKVKFRFLTRSNYWDLRTKNPSLKVKFRFLTRSQIGAEQGAPFGENQQGLRLWGRCSGDEATITKISEFLQNEGKISEEVADFLKKAEPQQIYEQLIEPIAWETESKPASFVEKSISDKLALHGHGYGIFPSEANKVVDSLLKEVWSVATQEENRVLTRVRFLEIFEAQATETISTQQWRHYQQMLAATTGSVGAGFIGGSSDITIQSQSPIQTADTAALW